VKDTEEIVYYRTVIDGASPEYATALDHSPNPWDASSPFQLLIAERFAGARATVHYMSRGLMAGITPRWWMVRAPYVCGGARTMGEWTQRRPATAADLRDDAVSRGVS
jgi:hypothetical protein